MIRTRPSLLLLLAAASPAAGCAAFADPNLDRPVPAWFEAAAEEAPAPKLTELDQLDVAPVDPQRWATLEQSLRADAAKILSDPRSVPGDASGVAEFETEARQEAAPPPQ